MRTSHYLSVLLSVDWSSFKHLGEGCIIRPWRTGKLNWVGVIQARPWSIVFDSVEGRYCFRWEKHSLSNGRKQGQRWGISVTTLNKQFFSSWFSCVVWATISVPVEWWMLQKKTGDIHRSDSQFFSKRNNQELKS